MKIIHFTLLNTSPLLPGTSLSRSATGTRAWRTSAGSSCRWSWRRSSRTTGEINTARRTKRKVNRKSLLSAFSGDSVEKISS